MAAAGQLSKLTGPGACPQRGRGGDHQRRQRCQRQRRHQTCWVACVAAAAAPITTPLAGIAEAAETPYSPTAAAVTAAKPIILSVIAPSTTYDGRNLVTAPEIPGPRWMFDAFTSPREV